MLQSVLTKTSSNELPKSSEKAKPEGFSKYYNKKDTLNTEKKKRSIFCLAKELAMKKKLQSSVSEKEESCFSGALEQLYNKQLTNNLSISLSHDRIETSSESVLLTEKLNSMVHYVNSSGITRTSITLSSDEFDTLKNTSITITHFDTAPNSFHVEFFTDQKGAMLLSQNIGFLQNHLETIFKKSSFFLAKPVYHSDFSENKRKREKIPSAIRKKSTHP